MKKIFLSLALLLSSLVTFGQEITQAEVDKQLSDLPFASFSIKVPTFKNKVYNITDAGAVGNGLVKCTEAINSTIKKCSDEGGGVVQIPAGLWLTGPITMQSNVNLNLAEGAIVIFSSDLNDYPLVDTGNGKYNIPDLINGRDLENVAVTGKGVFNGNGQDWRMVKKEKVNEKQWKAFIKTGEVSEDGKMYYPRKGFIAGEKLQASKKQADLTRADYDVIKPSLRPYMMAIANSKNVLIEGVTLTNSPKFAAYLRGMDGMVLHDVKVQNEWWYQNADGLDVSASKNVLYYKCTVNTGDDGLCLKSGNSKNGEFMMENIVMRDCKVFHAHGGFVIGSNTDGKMRNIFVDNCSFIGTEIGIRVKSGTGRGGKVTNVFCQNIYMKDIIEEAVLFELDYEDKGAVKLKDMKIEDAKVPDFDGFSIKNVYCDGAKTAISIGGNDYMNVKNVLFQNVIIKANDGVKSSMSSGITFDNVNIISKGQPYRLSNASNITFKNIKDVPSGSYIKILGEKTQNIKIENSSIKKEQVELQDAKPNVVSVK
jgi:polygalacturonase